MKALIGFVFAVTLSMAAHAEKIAVLDIQRALLTSKAAKDYDASMKAEFSQDQQALVDLEKQVKSARDKVTKNKDLASADELKKMKLQFQKVFTEYQRSAQTLQQKKMQREQDFIQKMRPELDKALKALVAQEKIDLVVSRQAVFHADNKLDITQKIVELLNKQ